MKPDDEETERDKLCGYSAKLPAQRRNGEALGAAHSFTRYPDTATLSVGAK
jgi:hypothetical protein